MKKELNNADTFDIIGITDSRIIQNFITKLQLVFNGSTPLFLSSMPTEKIFDICRIDPSPTRISRFNIIIDVSLCVLLQLFIFEFSS